MMMKKIYTDGSSRGNPGVGGYGVCIFDEDGILIKSEYKRYELTTNNQAELNGVLRALEITQDEANVSEKFIIYCESAYCVNACNDWIYTWANNGWKTANKGDVKNVELMKEIYKYLTISFPNFRIEKIKGHSKSIENEIADSLATLDKNKYYQLIRVNNIVNKAEDI